MVALQQSDQCGALSMRILLSSRTDKLDGFCLLASCTDLARSLQLIEGFFSKFARSVLRHIRVTSKHELKQRIMAGIDDVNRHPVIHTWSYKLAEAA